MALSLSSTRTATQNNRLSIQPALPNFSLLFRSKSTEKAESTSIDSLPEKIDEGEVENQSDQHSTPIIDVDDSPKASTDPEPEPTESSVHGSPESKTISASTASPSGTPSVSTPATQELAADVPNYGIHNDKEVIPTKSELEAESGKLQETEQAHSSVLDSANVEDKESSEEEAEHGSDSANVRIDQSESVSADHEDDQQVPASSSATSLGPELDDKAPAPATEEEGSKYIPNGYPTFFNTQTEDVQSFAHSRTSSHATQSFPTPKVSTVPTLQDYFLHLADSKDYADWLVQIHSPIPKAQSFQTCAHSILLLRSSRMQRLLTRQQTTYGTNILDLYPPRYINPHAFESALRWFYSDTFIHKDFFLQQPAGVNIQVGRLHNLDYILSYWIAGIELGLDAISQRAETYLSDYLDWDLIETAYKAANEIAKSEISSNTTYMTGTDYFVMSKSITRLVLNFLVSRLDLSDFKLDTTSTTNVISPLLPQVDENRPRTNPALAAMVFGSMPSTSADVSPISQQSYHLTSGFSPRDTIASNILLNLDFENLHRFNGLLQRRGGPGVSRIMDEVIQEREARREKVLNAQTVSNEARMADKAKWDVVGHQESFANGVLTEKRVAFLLPSSK